MKDGRIVQVMGPVVDVEFQDSDLPHIDDALEVINNNKKCVMEVAQHIGDNTVRCIMLAASEGLSKELYARGNIPVFFRYGTHTQCLKSIV